jgi:DNA-directed RNA polymerase beta' subunit
MAVETSRVSAVRFGIFDSADHKRRSCVEVDSFELFIGDIPATRGVYDSRMGTTDHHYHCLTCGLDKKMCLGHPGSLVLKTMVLNPIAIGEIRRWLKLICHSCGRPVIDLSDKRSKKSVLKLNDAISATQFDKKVIKCFYCEKEQPKILKDPEDNFTFYAIYEKEKKKLYPHQIAQIFDRISMETVQMFDKSPDFHPRKFVLDTIQFPPATIRPGVRKFGSAKTSATSHDFTTYLQAMVKKNQQMKEITSMEVSEVEDRQIEILQQFYYNMIHGASTTQTTTKRTIISGSKPPPAILRRFPRKAGRIRQGLLGSQTLFISRTTISGNTRLRLDEIGIPISIAKTLQFMEIVQDYNRKTLRTFFQNGRKQYPGSTILIKASNGARYDVENIKSIYTLMNGDILYRDIITGDYIMYNRPPTLERSSIGCHRAFVLEDPIYNAFQMNVSVCANYNADFDGDQMALWVPFDVLTMIEASILSHISNWFISTKTSGSTNGQLQDAVIGSYELTKHGVEMNAEHAMMVLQMAKLTLPIIEQRDYSGRELISILLKTTPITYRGVPQYVSPLYEASDTVKYYPDERSIVINEGIHLSGILDAKTIGEKKVNSLFQAIARRYGSQAAIDKLYSYQQIVLEFLSMVSFTIKTTDMIVDKKTRDALNLLVSKALQEADDVTTALKHGDIIPPIELTTHEYYEIRQKNALTIDDAERFRLILNAINPKTNGLFKMIATKAKGENANLLHIIGSIGQVTINEARISENFGFRRTLPYYPRFATSPFAYGFIANCYISGLTTGEFVCSSMGARFDLIQKALSTASTGFFNRKSVMNNQSEIVDNYRRVTKDQAIVQFIYNEDGCDARNLEMVSFADLLTPNDETIISKCSVKASASCQPLVDAHMKELFAVRNILRHSQLNLENTDFIRPATFKFFQPINVESIIESIILARKTVKGGGKTKLMRSATRTPKPATDETPKVTTDETPKAAPKVTTDETPKAAPKVTTDETPKATTKAAPKVTTDETPKVTTDETPKAAPKATTKPAAKATPKTAAKPAAKTTPDATSEDELKTKLEMVSTFVKNLPYIFQNEMRARSVGEIPEYLVMATTAVKAQILYNLSPAALTTLSMNEIKMTFSMIHVLYSKALIEYGTCAGILAVQSITEPLTQYMLDSHHRSVSGGTSKSALTRAEEIFSRKMQTDTGRMMVMVKPEYETNEKKVREIATTIEYIDFEQFVEKYMIIYESLDNLVYPPTKTDKLWIKEYLESRPTLKTTADITKWCFRVTIDKINLVLKHINLETIINKMISENWFIAHTSESADEIIIRFFLKSGAFKKKEESEARVKKILANDIFARPIRGIAGVQNTMVEKVIRHRISDDGSVVQHRDIYAIKTVGSNIAGVSTNTDVDTSSIVSTSIDDTYKMFGIEAARMKIVRETQAMMGDKSPSMRHILLYADELTRQGRLSSIERTGLARRERKNILLNIAFDSPVQFLINSALNSAESKVYGVAGHRLLGSTPQIGSNYNQLVVNERFVSENATDMDKIVSDL